MKGPVNGARGETEIVLAGRRYALRPTFGALAAIESGTGKSLLDLAREAAAGLLRVSDMAWIVWACAEAVDGQTVPDREAIGEAIVAEGIVAMAAPIGALLTAALTGSAAKKKAPGRSSPESPT